MLEMWTIYDHPSDYPNGYIARRHLVGRGVTGPTDSVITAETLEELRQRFEEAGLYCDPRKPYDDACIVETWF